MKNIDKIKAFEIKELAEYIESVFLAGRYYESHKSDTDLNEMINYVE